MPRERTNATEAAKALVERNLKIVDMYLKGATFGEIAKETGVSVDTCKRAYADFRETGLVELKGENPEETVWELVQQYKTLRKELHKVFEAAKGNHAARVGAVKAITEILGRETELRQAVGLLPRHLGSLAVQIDLRYMQTQLFAVFEKYSDQLPDEIFDDLEAALSGGVEAARRDAARMIGE